MKKFLVLICCLLLAGCYVAPSLNLEYKYGACVKEWGSTEIKLDGWGTAHIKLVSKDQTVEKKVHLDADQIRSITNAIEEQDLDVLEKKYENEFVTGGMCYNLLVEYHRKSTVVNVSNVPVPQVQKIGKAVTDALTAAEPGWDKFT